MKWPGTNYYSGSKMIQVPAGRGPGYDDRIVSTLLRVSPLMAGVTFRVTPLASMTAATSKLAA